MKEIKKIIIFDDQDFGYNKEQYLKFIINTVKNHFKKCTKKDEYSISEDLVAEFYYYKDEKSKVFDSKNNSEVDDNWNNEIETKFSEYNNCIILCDYDWKQYNPLSFREKVFEAFKDKQDVLFVVYTSVIFKAAQTWIEKIQKLEHQCDIMDTLLTFSQDMDDRIRALEEAILDVW